MKLLFALFLTLALTVPTLAKTYKGVVPAPCSEVWAAVKDTLGHPDMYEVLASDDSQLNADYNVKHTAHVTVTGAILQRTNHVRLTPKGTGCEMDVVSNFSGWEHDDQGDFRKRVEESLATLKAGPAGQPSQPMKPAEPTK